jgi:hypothetical protein
VLKQADGSISIQTPETMNNTEYKLHSRWCSMNTIL